MSDRQGQLSKDKEDKNPFHKKQPRAFSQNDSAKRRIATERVEKAIEEYIKHYRVEA